MSAYRVAVSQRILHLHDFNERRDCIDQRILTWLQTAGCMPFGVPNCFTNESVTIEKLNNNLFDWLNEFDPQAIVLSGGDDIGTHPDRDRTEKLLLSWALEKRRKVLGLCRGMQMLAVQAGGKLVSVGGHVATRHDVHGQINGEKNSYHNFGILECPSEYEILAQTQFDGCIEAIRHRHLPWEGWMWHPERESILDSYDLQRAQRLFFDRS